MVEIGKQAEGGGDVRVVPGSVGPGGEAQALSKQQERGSELGLGTDTSSIVGAGVVGRERARTERLFTALSERCHRGLQHLWAAWTVLLCGAGLCGRTVPQLWAMANIQVWSAAVTWDKDRGAWSLPV